MTAPERQVEMVTVTIDGVEKQVPAGELLIKAAQNEGTYIPRFCWHERMKPVGMCRMCLVQIETPRGPAMVTSCTTTVVDGMIVETAGGDVSKAQEAVLEFLLANHPLDCPVCDKGGECPLQDQALSHGPGESRFVEIKRTFEKPIPISDLVYLDRERCILCARCTRFSEEISGDPLIEFKERANQTEVNTFPNLPFSSYFSGNTVQICPVGALTARPYRFKARPWDLEKVESSSLFDTAHPRIEVHTSQNQILRFLGVDNPETNHGWLSDKARFGFEYIGSPDRLTTPLIRRDGELVEVSWTEALEVVANRLELIRDEDGGDALGVIGGAQGTNEDAYALSKFARVVLNTNNIDARTDLAMDPSFLAATADRATIDDLDTATAIVVWGPDLKEEHPTLYLRVRRAAQELGVKLVVVHPRATGLDDRATLKLTYRPGAGFDLLSAISEGEHPELLELLAGEKVVALVGVASAADGPQLGEAVAALVRERASHSRILPLHSKANVFGALDMGLAPGLLPGRVAVGSTQASEVAAAWSALPSRPGRDLQDMLAGLNAGEVRGLLLVGADPIGDSPHDAAVREAFEAVEYLISIDTFIHQSNQNADVILPAATVTEKEGTVTNIEGRVQKVNQIKPAPGQARPDRAIIADIAALMGVELGLSSAEVAGKEIAEVAPAYREITWDRLEWEFPNGMLVGSGPHVHIPVALKGNRGPGAEMVLHSARVMYDAGVRMTHSPHLSRMARGPVAYINPADAPRFGIKEGVGVRLTTKHGDGWFVAELDPNTPAGVVYVPASQPGASGLGVDAVVRLSVAK